MSACEFAVNREAGVLPMWYRPHTCGKTVDTEVIN